MDMPGLSMKLQEIKQELRRLGLWQQHAPQWIHRYEAMAECNDVEFLAWLQFVYLPNKSYHGQLSSVDLIAPQSMIILSAVPDNGRLLQLLVELDALI